MFIPSAPTLISTPSRDTNVDLIFIGDLNLAHHLEPRKGGGGGGRGGGGGGRGGSSGKGGSGSKGGSKGGSTGSSKVPVSGISNGGKKVATSYGAGGGKPITIPRGQLFAGRTAGSGRRSDVYGNSVYGSGYPGVLIPYGVSHRDFPFYFWPVVWWGSGTDASAYLYDSAEYGLPSNTSRPGGPLATAQFQSNKTGSTFYVLADNITAAALIESVTTNCSFTLSSSNTSKSPTPYVNGSIPLPEQALQYYRASSVVLALNGYNDTAVLNGTQNPNITGPEAPLPSGTDMTLLACLNYTIGRGVPLIDAATRPGPPGMLALVLAWFVVADVLLSWF